METSNKHGFDKKYSKDFIKECISNMESSIFVEHCYNIPEKIIPDVVSIMFFNKVFVPTEQISDFLKDFSSYEEYLNFFSTNKEYAKIAFSNILDYISKNNDYSNRHISHLFFETLLLNGYKPISGWNYH